VSLGRTFEGAAELYDEVRPEYPDELYDHLAEALGGLPGLRALDLAAGTGIATRGLHSRGAHVVALDVGAALLRQLRRRSPSVPTVRADAERLPFAADSFDLAVCATAWHWLRTDRVLSAVKHVLRPGGYLALWWGNHRHGDGVDWEDAQSAVFERWDASGRGVPHTFPGARPSDAAADLHARGLEVVVDRVAEWERVVDLETHLRVVRTWSPNLALGEQVEDLITELRAALAPWPVVTERLWTPLVVARIA
jgi:SAM-dependent methyltransferase